MKVTRTFKTTIPIDGKAIRCQIRRMSQGEVSAFRRAYERFSGASDLERRLAVRKPGEEMAQQAIARPRTFAEDLAADLLERAEPIAAAIRPALDTAGELEKTLVDLVSHLRALVPEQPEGQAFVLTDEEIAERRLDELKPEERARLEEAHARHEAERDAFVAESISAFVKVEPDQITAELEDGSEISVTTGAQLVDAFSSRADVLKTVVDMIRIENMLSESRKKALRSLFDSSASSSAPATEASGSAPETTAAPVAAKASATSEAATVSSATE
jgi:hypothetical protein